MGNVGVDSLGVIRDLLDGAPQAWVRFHQRLAKTIWSSCRILSGTEHEAQDAVIAVERALQADNFRRLRSYNGASRLETFVALVTRDILSERVSNFFRQGDDARGWNAFQQFYRSDIERLIRRRLSGPLQEDARGDAYQDICLALVEGQYRRLKAYEGKGSFSGFVLHIVDRLLIDIIRKTNPRRRDSGADGTPPRLVSEDELDDLPSPDPSPEMTLLDHEAGRLLDAAAKVLRGALSELPVDEQLYLRIALSTDTGPPAREIARLMQYPVEEIYKIKRRVMARLEKEIEAHPDVKNWLASV